MEHSHVVWDWNGTLLDDLHVVIEAVNVAIAPLGAGPIDETAYRDHYTRPVRIFYDGIFGRRVSDEEWLRLDTGFHDAYFHLAEKVDLAPGAREAILLLSDSGWTQSLLSMSPHDWLIGIVDRLGIAPWLELVDGLSGRTGGLKAEHLGVHLERLQVPGGRAVVIGDTPDDVQAARSVGARPILFHGGSHHLDLLQAQDAPVAETLLEAARLAIG